MGESGSKWSATGVRGHREFVRRLARSLVRDEHRAEDLEQDTWLAALGSGGPEASTFGRLGFAAQRAWLAVVARRRAMAEGRSRSRRRDRELAVGGESGSSTRDPQASAADLAEQMELHQRLIEACLSLPEPYRDILALRYFEALEPPEIAARLDLPLETVRTRLKRARARLRDAFAQRNPGDGNSTHLALMVLAGEAGGLPPATLGLPLAAPASLPWTGALLMKIQATVGIVVVGLVAYLGWRALDPDAAPDTTLVASNSAGEADPLGGPELNIDGGARVEAPDIADVDPTVEEPAESEATALPRVRIEVQGSDGQWTTGHRGSFRARAEGKPPVDDWEVEVAEGTFAMDAIGPYEIHELWLDGRAAHTLEPVQAGVSRVDPDAGSREVPVVRAVWIPDASLRVVDARTDADLEGVVLYRGRNRFRDRVHPGRPEPEQVLLESASSPIPLPSIDGVQQYWAWAPGYAWGYLQFEHRTGGERVIALEPGASLDVRLIHAEPDLPLFVRLYDPERDVLRRCNGEIKTNGDERVVFDGLPPGTYELCAEIGQWWDPPTLLAESLVVVPDEGVAVETLELDLEALGAPPVSVTGRLAMPPGHPDLDVTLALQPFDRAAIRKGDRVRIPTGEMHPIPGSPGSYRFDAGDLSPGDYVAIVSSLQFGQRFVVTEAPVDDLFIELPPVHTARVEVIDSVSGDPLPVDVIAWSGSYAPSGMNMWGLQNAERQGDEEFIEFLATEGSISITLTHEGYGRGHQGMHIGPGINEAILEVDPLPGVRIVLLDGSSRVPVVFPIQPGFLDEGEDPVLTWRERNHEDGSCIARAPGPGAYLLRINGLEGYEPVPDQPVDLGEGDLQELEIKLVRLR